MSTLSQFFGSGGGGSSTMSVRVQLQEGGGGATCVSHCYKFCEPYAAPSTTYCSCILIAGKGGGHADLNLAIEPGSTCPVTVGYGATSYRCPFSNTFLGTGPLAPCPSTYQCAGCIVGKKGDFGGASAFGSGSCCLGFVPDGCATFCSQLCTLPPGSAYLTICDVQYVPKFDTTNLGDNKQTIQNIGECSLQGGKLIDYDNAEGQRAYTSPETANLIAIRIPQGSVDKRMWYCLINPETTHICCCLAYSGGADRPAQAGRWFGACAITEIGCPCTGQIYCDCTNGSKNNMFQRSNYTCGGVVSTITGTVCAYGVGGHSRYHWPSGTYPGGTLFDNVEHCQDDHSRFRFPGSGAGGNTVWSPNASFPTGPYSDGCPGSVIIQYPDEFAAATVSSPSVVDCSPNTPGSRTYKFLCPGSITFP